MLYPEQDGALTPYWPDDCKAMGAFTLNNVLKNKHVHFHLNPSFGFEELLFIRHAETKN